MWRYFEGGVISRCGKISRKYGICNVISLNLGHVLSNTCSMTVRPVITESTRLETSTMGKFHTSHGVTGASQKWLHLYFGQPTSVPLHDNNLIVCEVYHWSGFDHKILLTSRNSKSKIKSLIKECAMNITSDRTLLTLAHIAYPLRSTCVCQYFKSTVILPTPSLHIIMVLMLLLEQATTHAASLHPTSLL